MNEHRILTAVGTIQVWRWPGAGPPVVYLHSAAGEGPGVVLLDQLGERYDVIAPMFPGFAESEGIDLIDDIEDAVFHLLDLFDRLGFASAPALVGSSLGGWMAAEVAARYPSSVSTLVLIGPAGLHIEGARIGEIFGRRPGDLAEDLFLDQSHPIAAVMHQMDSLEDNRLAEIPFEMIRPTLQSLQATAKIAWNPYLHDPKLVRLLPRVTAPTLVIHGAQDRLIPRVHASTYAETIPNARLADVDQAGHLVALEKPGEVAALIEAHLHGAGDVDKNGHGAAGAGPV